MEPTSNRYGLEGEGPASKEAKEAAQVRENAKKASVSAGLSGIKSSSISEVNLV